MYICVITVRRIDQACANAGRNRDAGTGTILIKLRKNEITSRQTATSKECSGSPRLDRVDVTQKIIRRVAFKLLDTLGRPERYVIGIFGRIPNGQMTLFGDLQYMFDSAHHFGIVFAQP